MSKIKRSKHLSPRKINRKNYSEGAWKIGAPQLCTHGDTVKKTSGKEIWPENPKPGTFVRSNLGSVAYVSGVKSSYLIFGTTITECAPNYDNTQSPAKENGNAQ